MTTKPFTSASESPLFWDDASKCWSHTVTRSKQLAETHPLAVSVVRDFFVGDAGEFLLDGNRAIVATCSAESMINSSLRGVVRFGYEGKKLLENHPILTRIGKDAALCASLACVFPPLAAVGVAFGGHFLWNVGKELFFSRTPEQFESELKTLNERLEQASQVLDPQPAVASKGLLSVWLDVAKKSWTGSSTEFRRVANEAIDATALRGSYLHKRLKDMVSFGAETKAWIERHPIIGRITGKIPFDFLCTKAIQATHKGKTFLITYPPIKQACDQIASHPFKSRVAIDLVLGIPLQCVFSPLIAISIPFLGDGAREVIRRLIAMQPSGDVVAEQKQHIQDWVVQKVKNLNEELDFSILSFMPQVEAKDPEKFARIQELKGQIQALQSLIGENSLEKLQKLADLKTLFFKMLNELCRGGSADSINEKIDQIKEAILDLCYEELLFRARDSSDAPTAIPAIPAAPATGAPAVVATTAPATIAPPTGLSVAPAAAPATGAPVVPAPAAGSTVASTSAPPTGLSVAPAAAPATGAPVAPAPAAATSRPGEAPRNLKKQELENVLGNLVLFPGNVISQYVTKIKKKLSSASKEIHKYQERIEELRGEIAGLTQQDQEKLERIGALESQMTGYHLKSVAEKRSIWVEINDLYQSVIGKGLKGRDTMNGPDARAALIEMKRTLTSSAESNPRVTEKQSEIHRLQKQISEFSRILEALPVLLAVLKGVDEEPAIRRAKDDRKIALGIGFSARRPFFWG